jgi:hypothetical protein
VDKEKSAVVVKTKKTRHEPLIAFLSGPANMVEELFSKAPEKTAFGESMVNSLTGAAYNEIEKLEPITEKQLKAIFPRATATRMVDPLKTVDKTRIHDNVRRDGSTFMALFTLANFTLGAETSITLGLNRKYANQQREDEQLELIQNNPEWLDVLEDLMNRDEDVDLHTRQTELLFAAGAFGRSVQVKQYGEGNLPCRLIPLASPRLGRVWVDKYSWDFLGVEYLDYTTDKRILLAKDVIHYEENDFSITPNSRFYGMSLAESSIAIGERNRAANEIAIPEIMKRYFTPLMKVMTHTKSQTRLNQIRDAFKAGKTVFINDDIEIEVIPIQHDLEKVRDTVTEGAKQIYRNFSVPLAVGFQDEQNRATLEGSMLQWYEGPIAFRRSILDSVMWRQWYKPQLEIIFENRLASKIGQGMGSEESLFSYMEEAVKENSPAINKQKKEALPFRIVTEFVNIKTVGFLDKLAAVAQFYDRKLLSADLAREEAGLGKYNDQMQEEEMKTQTLANDMFSQQSALRPFAQEQGPQPPGKQPVTTSNLETQANSTFKKGLPTASTSSKSSEDRGL